MAWGAVARKRTPAIEPETTTRIGQPEHFENLPTDINDLQAEGDRQPGGPDGGVADGRDLTRERLSQSLADMLNKAGDTLWELSKATPDRDTQKLYMEAKEKLLPQRELMEERFRIRYLTEFDNRAGQARKARPSFSDYTDTSLELGLVGEDDINESLKVNEMAGKLRGYCEEELLGQKTSVHQERDPCRRGLQHTVQHGLIPAQHIFARQ